MSTVAITIDSNAARVLRDWFQIMPDARERIRKAVLKELILEKENVIAGTGIKIRRGASGLLGRLTTFATSDKAAGLDAGIGFRKTAGFPYELSQEFGAKARPGGAMTIPLTPEARKAGSPRNLKRKLFVPHGTHVLAEARAGKKVPGGVQFIAHYALVKSIKPRLGFRKALAGSGGRISQAIMVALARGAT